MQLLHSIIFLWSNSRLALIYYKRKQGSCVMCIVFSNFGKLSFFHFGCCQPSLFWRRQLTAFKVTLVARKGRVHQQFDALVGERLRFSPRANNCQKLIEIPFWTWTSLETRQKIDAKMKNRFDFGINASNARADEF